MGEGSTTHPISTSSTPHRQCNGAHSRGQRECRQHPPPLYNVMVPQAAGSNTQPWTKGAPQHPPYLYPSRPHSQPEGDHTCGQRESRNTHHLCNTAWSHEQLEGTRSHGQSHLSNTFGSFHRKTDPSLALHPQIPSALPAACGHRVGHWDMSSMPKV